MSEDRCFIQNVCLLKSSSFEVGIYETPALLVTTLSVVWEPTASTSCAGRWGAHSCHSPSEACLHFMCLLVTPSTLKADDPS